MLITLTDSVNLGRALSRVVRQVVRRQSEIKTQWRKNTLVYFCTLTSTIWRAQELRKQTRDTFEAGLIINLVEKKLIDRYSHTFYNALLTTRIHPSDYVSVKGTEVQKVYRNIIFPYCRGTENGRPPKLTLFAPDQKTTESSSVIYRGVRGGKENKVSGECSSLVSTFLSFYTFNLFCGSLVALEGRTKLECRVYL